MPTSEPEFSEFSIRGLQEFVKRINQNPDLLESDWQGLVQRMFGMTTQQKNLINGIQEPQKEQLTGHFKKAAQHIRDGGYVQLKVVQQDIGKKALYMFLTPKRPSATEMRTITAQTAIRIICCDPYCGDWTWCWNVPD